MKWAEAGGMPVTLNVDSFVDFRCRSQSCRTKSCSRDAGFRCMKSRQTMKPNAEEKQKKEDFDKLFKTNSGKVPPSAGLQGLRLWEKMGKVMKMSNSPLQALHTLVAP